MLTTNHVHLLITPERDAGVGGLMQSLGRRYVGHINRLHGRTGTLWEGRFKSTTVDAEDYVLACYRYSETNPVRARMVERAEDHRWSSHGANAFGQSDALVSQHGCHRALGRTQALRQAAYRSMFQDELAEETIDILRDAT